MALRAYGCSVVKERGGADVSRSAARLQPQPVFIEASGTGRACSHNTPDRSAIERTN